ncbi:MAG: enoyl-CoA hydratase [Miltoncostaeaceae bacterium]|nr:enoyl-CoA hydratase [Miltoncostaeaceae bacterium]
MIEVERHGAVTVLRLAHGKVNALDTELLLALRQELAPLAHAPGAVVLTGAGSAFSAGVDLFRVVEGGDAYVAGLLPALVGVLGDLLRFPRPVVAAVNGHAIAGGCIIAETADLRLMAAGKGRMGIPELLVGVAFPAVGIEVMRHVTGGRGLAQLVLGGGTFEPQESLRRGLVDELVEPDRLLEEAIARAERMAAIRPAVFGHAKSQLWAPVLERIERVSPPVDAEAAALWQSPEARTAIQEYVGRTLPARS